MRKILTPVILATTLSVSAIAQTPVVQGHLLRSSVNASKTASSSDDKAKLWLQSALEAMGGGERLRAIKSVSLKGNGHTNLLEQSERPEGPWIVSYEEINELRDLEGRRLRQTIITRGAAAGPEITSINSEGKATSFIAGAQPAPFRSAPASDEWLALSPERVLLTALAAPDLHTESDTMMQGSPHHSVAFSWQNEPVRILLNANTSLPTMIESVRTYPYDSFWGVWGDVRTRTYLSLWTLEAGGLHYPRQWDVERNGQPYKSFAVTDLKFNSPLPADAFNIPANVFKAFESRKPTTVDERPLGRPDRPAQEIAPNVIQIPGSWNITLVRQADGLVIVEAPISSGYSAKVIAEAERRFPNVPIKAVISTSDSWPHIGGVREYVARGIPVYALDLNRPIIERLISAPHRLAPDALSRTPRKPNLRIVSQQTVIGAGANRLELYPVRTETGERMIMVYLPEHKLLYGSDLIQGPAPDGSFFMPEYLSELMDAVKREGLNVNSAFAMHAGLTPWTKITEAVVKAASESK
jgi:hypothetical protein